MNGEAIPSNSETQAPKEDTETPITKAIDVLFSAGDVVELRAFSKPGHISSGYYNDPRQLASQAAALDRRGDMSGIYVTLNQVDPALLSRRSNRMLMRMGKKDSSTSDADIIARRWLPIDLDPVRPSGISSTDDEHQLAFDRALEIVSWLSERGYPKPLIADSGNGWHVLYRIDLPNDPRAAALVKNVLQVLDGIFSDDAVMVDTANFNAARIWKLYGTVGRKGDNTRERPHRRAEIYWGHPDGIVSEDLLAQVAAALPNPPQGSLTSHSTGTILLSDWLRENGITVRSEKPWQGGTMYLLDSCPFSSAHEDGAYAIQFPSGAIAAGCHHNSCQGKTWQDLRAMYDPAHTKVEAPIATTSTIPPEQNQTPEFPEDFEIICNNRGLQEIAESAVFSLSTLNHPPVVFVRSGGLVCIGQNEQGVPVIQQMGEAAVRGRMARCAWYVRVKADKNGFFKTKISPPIEVVRDVMVSQKWPFPALKNIIETPTMRADGRIISVPGYDTQTGLYYAPAEGFSFEPPDEKPTPEEIQQARLLLEEAVIDFPFVDQASLANVIAAMITPFVRPLINGPVPMAILDKPQAGTGASLLAEVIALIATGRPAAMLQAPKSLEEWRKKITALLIDGRSVIVVDNVEGRLYAGPLAAALTATIWQDRVLGRSEMISIPHSAVWIANGNNIQLGGDLPRRCYWIKLDAKMPRPWQRNGFVHPDLKEWVTENRGRIVSAILTLIRAWIASGRPVPDSLPPLGGFESWQNVIGGIMYRGGWVDFLGNQEQMYAESDTDTPQWEGFLRAWHSLWQDNPVTSSTVATRLDSDSGVDLMDALPDQLAEAYEKPRSFFVRSLGAALSSKNQVRFPSGYRVEKAGSEKRAVQWRVIKDEN